MKRLFILVLMLVLLGCTAIAESTPTREFTIDEQAYDVYLDISYVMDNTVEYLEELRRLWDIALHAESVEDANNLALIECISEDYLIALTDMYLTKYGYSDSEYKQFMFSGPDIRFKEKTDLIWYYLALGIEAKYLVSMDSLKPYLDDAMSGIRSIMATDREYPFLKDLQNYYKETVLIHGYASDFNDNYTGFDSKLDSYKTGRDSWSIDFEFIFNPEEFKYVREVRAAKSEEKKKEVYSLAEVLENSGDYAGAINLYWQCKPYKNASNRIEECFNAIEEQKLDNAYQAGLSLMEKEKYSEAHEIFLSISGFMNSAELAQECSSLYCSKVEELFSNRKEYESLAMYSYHDDYHWNLSFQQNLSSFIKPKLSGGIDYTVGVTPNGSILFKGLNYQESGNVSDWQNIVAIAASNHSTVGLKANGTVVATGSNSDGQCNINSWTNIVSISMGLLHTVGLKSDGTVVATGYNDYGGCDVQDWNDIIAISAGSTHTLGLKSDGTVVAAGVNGAGQCSVEEWRNITAVAAGSGFSVGLKSDGTVVATGRNKEGQCNVNQWSNIISIAVCGYCTIGLKNDGSVVIAGDSFFNAVTEWNDIAAISTGTRHIIGLKTDGTLIATGKNDWSQCELQDLNLLD